MADVLEGPWNRVFELAWDAWQAGSFPVGALLVGSDGRWIAEGRNRMFEPDAPPGQLSNSALAHAETNVLAQVPPNAHLESTLYTSLEPCLLCASALLLARIGQVRYAGSDSLWDVVDRVPSVLSGPASRDWPRKERLRDPAMSAWGSALPAVWYLRNDPEGADSMIPPPVVQLARQCLELGLLEARTHEQALSLVRPALEAYAGKSTGKAEAIVAVIQRGDHYLIIERGPESSSSGFWAPLSGRMEPGERQDETVVREIREELGVEATPGEKVWECESDDGRYLLHWWTAEIEGDELEPDPGEVGAVRWVTAEEFVEMRPTFVDDREFFRRRRAQ